MICYDCIYYKFKGIMLQNGDEYYESICDKDKNKDIQNVCVEECEHFEEDNE